MFASWPSDYSTLSKHPFNTLYLLYSPTMSLSNNPFALSAESRYPDINAGQQQQPQYGQQQQQYGQQQGYPQQQQQQQQYAQQYQQQAAPQMYVQPTGYAGQASGFQPSSQFASRIPT